MVKRGHGTKNLRTTALDESGIVEIDCMKGLIRHAERFLMHH
jgi:hypothetical protein